MLGIILLLTIVLDILPTTLVFATLTINIITSNIARTILLFLLIVLLAWVFRLRGILGRSGERTE